MATYTAKYTKLGAEFANAEEANADRRALIPEDIKAAADASKASMLSSGILTAPDSLSWDQATQTLTLNRYISDYGAYINEFQTYVTLVTPYNVANGWITTQRLLPDL